MIHDEDERGHNLVNIFSFQTFKFKIQPPLLNTMTESEEELWELEALGSQSPQVLRHSGVFQHQAIPPNGKIHLPQSHLVLC